ILMVPMEGERKPQPILNSQYAEEWASVSPDGRWLAYSSDESGQLEVYVMPFPGTSGGAGGKSRISSDGGERPHWGANGRELYYYTGSLARGQKVKVLAVAVESKNGFQAGKPRVLFEGPYFQSFHDYAPTPDGRGFIFIGVPQSQSGPSDVGLMANWFEERKRKARGGK